MDARSLTCHAGSQHPPIRIVHYTRQSMISRLTCKGFSCMCRTSSTCFVDGATVGIVLIVVLSFTRTDPLTVRLEERRPANSNMAYEETVLRSLEPNSDARCISALGGDSDSDTTVYHLVFSYSDKQIAKQSGRPFNYVEGQSVSFVNLCDTRHGSAVPTKPRLYSIASSLEAPEFKSNAFFSLVSINIF